MSEETMTGEECFFLNGQSIGLKMIDFWRFQYSNRYNMQEYLAEFIVAKALGKKQGDNLEYWSLYDIKYRGKRIEVKETSYYHPWNKDSKVSNQRYWGITKANSEYENESQENKYERQNDIYVFCLNTGNSEESSNPLELNNWEFYIAETSIINKNFDNQKTVSLGRIKSMFKAISYVEIKNEVDNIIDKMESKES